MKGGAMKYLLFILILVTALGTAGCVENTGNGGISPAGTTTVPLTPPAIITPATTFQLPELTLVPHAERRITDGFWCRDTTMNIRKAPTAVRECYQFFPDGTYKWGYNPGWPMGKSPSCSGDPAAKCQYLFNAKGQYEVEGGYSYTLSGTALIDPHDPPYLLWSSTGIP
jgi:hypothetical protein